MLDRNILKDWFKTRKKPTQGQFWQWIDACFFKGEKLPINDVDGLENTLQNIQLNINTISPSKLVSGGILEVISQNETEVIIGIMQTSYEIRGVLYNIPASQKTVVRPTVSTLSRFDVFYLDPVGFNVKKGVESSDPIKPQLESGQMELTVIYVGNDNIIEIVQPSEGDNLNDVVTRGSSTSSPISIGGLVVTGPDQKPGISLSVQTDGTPGLLLAPELGEDEQPTKSITLVTPSDLDDNYEIELPSKGGKMALLDDLVGSTGTLEDVVQRGNQTSLPIITGGVMVALDIDIQAPEINQPVISLTVENGVPEINALIEADHGSATKSARIIAEGITGNRELKIPDKSGTIATKEELTFVGRFVDQWQQAPATLPATGRYGDYLIHSIEGHNSGLDKHFVKFWQQSPTPGWVYWAEEPEYFPETDYSGSITWGGTQAPTGQSVNKWIGQRDGKRMNLWIYLNFGTEGSGLTTFEMPLPTGAPWPKMLSNIQDYSGTLMYPGNAYASRTNAVGIVGLSRVYIASKGVGNAPVLVGQFASSVIKTMSLFFSYPID